MNVFTALFTNMRTVNKKPPSQLPFSLPSIIITITSKEPWNTETHKTDQNPPITNHKPWPFEPGKVKFCFLRGPLRWLTAAKNAIVSWVLNFRIRMSVKRAVHFQAFTFNYLFVKFLQKTNKSWPLSKPGRTLFIHEPRLDAANRNVGILTVKPGQAFPSLMN